VKKPVRIILILAAWAAVTWIFREKLLPVPKPDRNPPPHFRTEKVATTPRDDQPDSPPGAADPAPQPLRADSPQTTGHDDLTEVRGIGPVYQHRLADIGVTTFAQLAACDAASIAEQVEVRESQVREWMDQAREFAR
jgi:predicted flap endonuclease-1-like 5' DNA nuclease